MRFNHRYSSNLKRSEKDGALAWRSLFHTFEEFEHAPPLRFAIDGILQEDGINLVGGLAGHGKTLFMLAMVEALLNGFGLFWITSQFHAPAIRCFTSSPNLASGHSGHG